MTSITLKNRAIDMFETAQTATLPARSIARKSTLAYIGLHGLAFERAQMRVKQVRTARKAFFDGLVIKGEEVELDILARFKTTEIKPVAKKTVAKKATAKKAPTKKATKTVKTTKTVTADKYTVYIENVRKYDATANAAKITAIVKHLGIALQSRDGKFVACSDESERNTVRDSWLVKKLGVKGTAKTLDAKVAGICTQMKADRLKCRVTFYYLLAKSEGKLGAL
ncbi:MAG: DUF2853 family protein [Robiginitomaculum sp.]